MHAVAGARQHGQSRVEIFALKGAIERIGEQHDLASGFRADRSSPAAVNASPRHSGKERLR